MGIGAQVYPPLPIKTKPLPLSVAGCDARDTNITTVAAWTSTALPTTEPRQNNFFNICQLEGTIRKIMIDFLPEMDTILYFFI